MTTVRNHHIVNLVVNRYNDGLTSDVIITCPDLSWPYFGMGAKLDGSEPYIFGRALVISAHGNSSKDEADRQGTLVVRLGDLLTVRGYAGTYCIERTFNDNLKLVAVEGR